MTSFGAATRESPDGRECEFYKLAASGQPRDRRRGERQLSGSFINWRSRRQEPTFATVSNLEP